MFCIKKLRKAQGDGSLDAQPREKKKFFVKG